jgi:hypothetical protein
MAKQVGPLFFTGTIDGIIFYKVGDQYYTRSKGSYKSAKHMRRNPKYKRTMENADRFGMASKLAQEVYYHHVPKHLRKRGVFSQLTGLVQGWLQQGRSKEEAQTLLIQHCQTLSTPIQHRTTITAQRKDDLPKVVQRTPLNAQGPVKPKQARYLSRWKVKPNGRLHISKVSATFTFPETVKQVTAPLLE